MSRPSLVIVLAEDRRQQTLVRRYLECAGYRRHQIRLEPLPSGRGAGEQWVRLQYPKNVTAYRSRAANAETALVVVIDADTNEVEQRIQQLRNVLTEAGSSWRADEEKVAHLIPKRNVETWILCLDGSNVDEDTDYRQEPGVDERVKPAAATFFAWSRRNAIIPARCVPSLRTGIDEVKRLE